MSLESKLNRLFAGYGYQKFRMSKFEEYDLYAENKDFLTSPQLITFTDLDGSLLALKPDITLSIIKSTTAPRRVYYNEMVYRPRDHHYREIPQAGIECIGTVDLYREAEVIAMACSALSCIEEDYVLRISDVSLIRSVIEEINLPSAMRPFVIDALSGKNADYIRTLIRDGILSEADGTILIGLIDLYLPFSKGVKKVRTMVNYPAADAILDHLYDLAGVLDGFGVMDHVYLDFSLMNSMEYYNGVIFQGAVRSIPTSVLSGGRYDRLLKKMGKPYEAIGFAVYMDVVENSRTARKDYDGDIAVIYTAKDSPKTVARVMRGLARDGIRVLAVSKDEFTEESRWKRVLTLKEAKKEAGI
jgi:ATP phosphoribosyltransferase regulatory subunit